MDERAAVQATCDRAVRLSSRSDRNTAQTGGSGRMNAAVQEELAPQAAACPRGDTLAASVVLLLVMTAVQRLIGFGRGILFCRWLEPEQLGQWDVAFGFLNLAAPLAVMGLPGSFGRYVEYFRQRSQFHIFLRRTAAASAATSLIVVVAMV